MWYEGTFHRYKSPGTKVKVICKGQGQISGSCFSKDWCFGGISVSQTHLVQPSNNIVQSKIITQKSLLELDGNCCFQFVKSKLLSVGIYLRIKTTGQLSKKLKDPRS